MHHFHTYRLSDGVIVSSASASRAQASFLEADAGYGVIEHDAPVELLTDRVDVVTGKLIDPLDHAFAADLDAKWRRIVGEFPVLANPVPPTPVPKSPGGEQRFSVSAFWGDFANRAASGEWRLSATDDLTNMAGPFRSSGVCLEPVRTAGDLNWYDVVTPAQDEDLVLVRWDPIELQRIYKRNRGNAEWLAIYPEPNPLAVKVLKCFGGRWWLCCAESMLQLGKNTVLGVQRRCVRNGVDLYPLATPVPNIVPGAATDVYSATDAGPVNINLTAPATTATFQQVKYVTVTIDQTYTFEISASFRLGVTGNPGSFTVTTSPAVWNNGTTLQAADQGVDKTTNLIEPQTCIGVLSRPAGTYRVGVACSIGGDGVNNFSAGYRDINLRVAVIKR